MSSTQPGRDAAEPDYGSPEGSPGPGTPATGSNGGPQDPSGPAKPATDPQALDRGLLLVAACVVLGAIMSILDVTVVNVALPQLVNDFESNLATIQWVATGYTLALATVIPLTGWGAERFGTKRLYMTSIFLFVVGSVLSGLAWNDTSLIFFRILQGLGGGMVMPAGMTILTRAAGPQRLGRVMAVMGVPMLLGPILGPILGGWLVEDFSWRWIFFINAPIGALALVMCFRILPKDVPTPGHRLDWLGLALLSPGLALLIYGLAESSEEGGFGHAIVLVPMLAGALLLAAFVAHALRRGDDALIDLRLFTNKVFAASSVTMLLMIISVFGGMLLLPLYLQQVRLEGAFDTGLLLAPQGVGAMIAMPIAGTLVDRTGVGRVAPVGLLCVALSFVGLTRITADTGYWELSGYLFLMGVGMGFSMMPLMTGAMQTLRRNAVAKASTTLNIIQQTGSSIGTAVMVVILTAAISDRIPGAGSMGPESAGAATDAQAPDPAAVQQMLNLMAEAFGHTFWWAAGMVAIAFVVALVLLPKRKPQLSEEDSAEMQAHMMMG
ncbi:DHA2 family efflux MFS transporter permease subunit [Kineosporia rhizophila]|uniref:DHA2 family efflux MFS transporter permease subunit n=1 Tax=Kineosporia TaxID=49184 RepID=UPI001E5229A3|nr:MULTISPECIES: DHA2 family efflux MFS transporter permease subunit [Kineosporia]MCE0540704.1 DHA2 family efflux MFS transporter permease subunit [Kineosporia rhizophila]GLY18398.1 multidrug resistance protein B [Kineosporia sp. NBRC 101677]